MSRRIAFASTDGSEVDEHFGSARFFQIFDIDTENETYEFVEARRTDALCKGHCEGGFNHLLEALKDTDAIFASKIGQGAVAFMVGHGKRVFEAEGAVEGIIKELIAEKLLVE